MTEQERKLLALLQFLTPESYNAIMSSYGGGTAGDSDTVNKMAAMGTEAYDAYQTLVNGVNKMGWDDAVAAFESAVADGTIAITPDTAEIIKNSTLSSLGKQGTSGKSPGEVFSALGAPELALLAPYAQDKPIMTPANPYTVSSTAPNQVVANKKKTAYEKEVKSTEDKGLSSDLINAYLNWSKQFPGMRYASEKQMGTPLFNFFNQITPSGAAANERIKKLNQTFGTSLENKGQAFQDYQDQLRKVNQQSYENEAAAAYQRGVDRAMQKIQPTAPGQAFDEQKMRLLLSFLGQQG